MHSYDLAQKLIERFGKLLGLEGLTLQGGTHSCALEFDGEIVVTLEFHESTERLVLTSLVSQLPGADTDPLLRALMAANFTDYLHDGMTLGLDAHSGQIALMQSRRITELDDATFEQMMEAFVNKAELWKRRLEAALNGDPSQLPPTTPFADASMPDPASSAPSTARPLDGAHIFG